MPPTVSLSVVATGGSVVLNITPSEGLDGTDTVTISRYSSVDSTPVQLYSGVYSLVYIDDGEQLPSYLDFTTTYYYIVEDTGGTTTTAGVVPASELQIYPNWMDKMLFRFFKAGIDQLMPPNNFGKAEVLQAMPLTWGSEQLPMVVMNLDLQQQRFAQIGRDIYTNVTSNQQTKATIISRRYSVTVLTANAQERDYYKDVIIGMLYAVMPSLEQIGQNYEYDIQVAQSQVTQGPMQLGFYLAEAMLDITGLFNIVVNTNYGVIDAIYPVVSGNTTGSPVVVTLNY